MDNNSKQEYKEIGTNQANQAKEKAQQITAQKSKPVEESKTDNSQKADWRKGNFLEQK